MHLKKLKLQSTSDKLFISKGKSKRFELLEVELLHLKLYEKWLGEKWQIGLTARVRVFKSPLF